MKVREWMVPGLRGLDPDTPVSDALHAILRYGLNGMVVTDGEDHLLGVLTLSDIRRRTLPTQDDLQAHPEYMQRPETMEDRFVDVMKLRAADLMSTQIATVGPDADLVKAAALMQTRGVKQLPVVEDEKVVGTITVKDIAWAFAITFRRA